MNEPTEGIVCESCGHDDTPTKEYRITIGGHAGEYKRQYCDVCASTYLSKSVDYPYLSEERNIASSLGWVANEILDKLKLLERKVDRSLEQDSQEEVRVEVPIKEWVSLYHQIPLACKLVETPASSYTFSLRGVDGRKITFLVNTEE